GALPTTAVSPARARLDPNQDQELPPGEGFDNVWTWAQLVPVRSYTRTAPSKFGPPALKLAVTMAVFPDTARRYPKAPVLDGSGGTSFCCSAHPCPLRTKT